MSGRLKISQSRSWPRPPRLMVPVPTPPRGKAICESWRPVKMRGYWGRGCARCRQLGWRPASARRLGRRTARLPGLRLSRNYDGRFGLAFASESLHAGNGSCVAAEWILRDGRVQGDPRGPGGPPHYWLRIGHQRLSILCSGFGGAGRKAPAWRISTLPGIVAIALLTMPSNWIGSPTARRLTISS